MTDVRILITLIFGSLIGMAVRDNENDKKVARNVKFILAFVVAVLYIFTFIAEEGHITAH